LSTPLLLNYLSFNFVLLNSYLLPDASKKTKQKTQVKKKTLNPEFNEVKILYYIKKLKFLSKFTDILKHFIFIWTCKFSFHDIKCPLI